MLELTPGVPHGIVRFQQRLIDRDDRRVVAFFQQATGIAARQCELPLLLFHAVIVPVAHRVRMLAAHIATESLKHHITDSLPQSRLIATDLDRLVHQRLALQPWPLLLELPGQHQQHTLTQQRLVHFRRRRRVDGHRVVLGGAGDSE